MGVTYCNLKPIMKGSGHYHEIRWNVMIFNVLRWLLSNSPKLCVKKLTNTIGYEISVEGIDTIV
jgi:hypothetical protein